MYVDREVQIVRLCARDGIDRAAAERKIDAPRLSLEQKRALASTVIDNSGSVESLRASALSWYDQQRAKRPWPLPNRLAFAVALFSVAASWLQRQIIRAVLGV